VHLARMTRLRKVWLYETDVTAAGLKKIAALPDLQEIEISMDQLSADGLDDLHRLRPELKVTVTTIETDGSGFSRRRRPR